MNYVLNRKVKLGVRATRGHGNVHFVTREDSSGGALVIDQSASMLIEAMQRDPSYKPSASEFEVLERLATEGVVSELMLRKETPSLVPTICSSGFKRVTAATLPAPTVISLLSTVQGYVGLICFRYLARSC